MSYLRITNSLSASNLVCVYKLAILGDILSLVKAIIRSAILVLMKFCVKGELLFGELLL